jgi:hypothetical protein
MKGPELQPAYRSYVLRLWRSSTEETADWRASLEEVQTGERLGFASLEALIEHLLTIVAGATDRALGDEAPGSKCW